jgi:tetratricopeptide (TPR) repeat protein
MASRFAQGLCGMGNSVKTTIVFCIKVLSFGEDLGEEAVCIKSPFGDLGDKKIKYRYTRYICRVVSRLNMKFLWLLLVLAGQGYKVIAQDTAKIQLLIKRAESSNQAGNTYGAIKIYLDILDLDAGNYQAANALSGLYGHLHQPADQMAWAKKSIEMNPKYAMAYISLGNACGATGDVQNAIENYKKAEQLDPKSPFPPYCIGVIDESKGEIRDAIIYYKRSIDNDSLFLNGYCGLAVAYARLQDYTTAQNYINQALVIDPNSTKAREIKGRIKECIAGQ